MKKREKKAESKKTKNLAEIFAFAKKYEYIKHAHLKLIILFHRLVERVIKENFLTRIRNC